jgi:ubiquinone/menaquinone biosynthesis C-methylase UbiE
MGGTRTDEWFWRLSHLMYPGWPEGSLMEGALAHPQRGLLMDALASYEPIDSALEVGCGAGPNLVLLARRTTKARLVGIDVNRRAIAVGRAHFARNDLRNVELKVGRATALSQFPDGSFDVVFTDAALIYVGPERIQGVVAEMVRIARRGLVFMEYGSPNGTTQRNAHWAHDWQALLSQHVPAEHIELQKITPATWPGVWAEYGYLVNAHL